MVRRLWLRRLWHSQPLIKSTLTATRCVESQSPFFIRIIRRYHLFPVHFAFQSPVKGWDCSFVRESFRSAPLRLFGKQLQPAFLATKFVHLLLLVFSSLTIRTRPLVKPSHQYAFVCSRHVSRGQLQRHGAGPGGCHVSRYQPPDLVLPRRESAVGQRGARVTRRRASETTPFLSIGWTFSLKN